MRVEEEVDKADVANSVIVAIGGRRLPVDYDLFETVSGMFERECLLRHLFIVRNHPCRLDINTLVAAVDNKINFMSAADCRALRTGESNVQWAVDPGTGRRIIIEMNPRVSRSSTLDGFRAAVRALAEEVSIGGTGVRTLQEYHFSSATRS